MVKYIVVERNAREADIWREELGLPRKECLLLGWEWSPSEIKRHITGLYKDVTEGRIRLYGIGVKMFQDFYVSF